MKILVVCSGNTCRSPMAAGLLTLIAKSKRLSIDARSAGLCHHPGKQVAENAVTAMKELGIDISNDYSKAVTPELLAWADCVVAVQRSLADHVVENFPEIGSKVHHLQSDVRDPYCGSIAEYRDARDQLRSLLLLLVDSLGSTTR
jgi:protein-tyrosine-phosphatase